MTDTRIPTPAALGGGFLLVLAFAGSLWMWWRYGPSVAFDLMGSFCL